MTDAATDAPAKKRGRPPKAKPGDAAFKPDSRGPKPPHFPVYGESWEDADGNVKFWHGGGWYIDAPGTSTEDRAASMGAAAVAEMKGSAAAADAAGPDAERVEPETVVGEIVDEDPLGVNAEILDNPLEPVFDESDEELPAVAAIEELADNFAVGDLKYVVADFRDLMLGIIKEMPKLWGALPEAKQYDIARGIENAIAGTMQKIAEVVAARGVEPIACILESYAEKDGIKIALKLKPAGEAEECKAILGLHKAKGNIVLLTPASGAEYHAERRAHTDPDEPGLVLDPPEHPDDDSDLAGDNEDYGAGDGDD